VILEKGLILERILRVTFHTLAIVVMYNIIDICKGERRVDVISCLNSYNTVYFPFSRNIV
jgi:hypothetical protein